MSDLLFEEKTRGPILIVGAGRSGTKLLRSILVAHPDVVCFPREINYVWRYGNAGFATDELRPEHARPEVVRYIRKRFERLKAGSDSRLVVEKTCANVLRVGFVHTVFPEAFVIHLVRDGRAVAESARRRWKARPELRYLLEKARWVPLRDVPYYALRYLRFQLGRLRSGEGAGSSWGPRFAGLDRLVEEYSLIEVCGLQWKACVQAADAAIKGLPSNQRMTVRYEDLVTEPTAVTRQVFEQARLQLAPECRDYVEQKVVRKNIDKWRRELSGEDLGLLVPHIESELLHHGYEL